MRHNRLKLIGPDNSGKAADDDTAEPAVLPAALALGPPRLHLVDADDGPFPDDAA